MLQLREEAKILQYSTVLVGYISARSDFNDLPIIVAAYAKNGKERAITHFTCLHTPGPYELIVPKGEYQVVAFGDRNKNLIFDAGEPAGQYIGTPFVSAPSGGVVDNLDIVILEAEEAAIDFPAGTKIPSTKIDPFHSTSPGAIADLNHRYFSAEYGQKGVWAPVEFFKEISGNIYFLEEYDPDKIPILFVHGAGGSPQDFRDFYASIDRDTFQPWFFYYPSGSSLDSMAHLMFWKLYTLQSKYKFNELHITAHSMGGLVARSFIINFAKKFPPLTRFISISTPWGGEKLAESGVNYSPAVVPSWEDMLPEGRFIQSIFREKIPESIDFFLFFGHKGNRNLLRPNNDKAVTLASMLDQRAQQDAKMIYGFDEDHVSILKSEQVLAQYNAILAAALENKKNAAAMHGNRLQVNFSYATPDDTPKPRGALSLRSTDEKRTETWIFMGPEDSGRKLGPFPAGNYEASFLANGYSPTPKRLPITISEAQVGNVTFSMQPSGYLQGYLVAETKDSITAGAYHEPDPSIKVESITLHGDGVSRTVTPQIEEGGSFTEAYLTETDFVAKGYFYFFDLPAGQYQLSVHAPGYKPFISTQQVIPGQYDNELAVELAPL